jgi:hypothetical protein
MTRTSLVAGLLAAGATSTAVRLSAAASPVAVDVVLHDAPEPHKTLTVEWNPLSLFIDRFSVDVVVVPGDHHGLVLSPFYTWASTAAYATNIDGEGNALPYTLNVLAQTFKGFGGELGYRYYFDQGGPRGLFVGPSLLAAALTATAGYGSQTSFADLGIAADAGYEALVADCIAISVGAGLQYTFTTKSIPDQQLPASIYANDRLYPRLLLSMGYAF